MYSDELYTSAKTLRAAATGVDAFSHTHAINTGKIAAGVNDKLDPKGVNRESRDSDVHPTSNAIIVGFDVTGSMSSIPRTLQQKLCKLMGVLNAKAAIEHPQILFAAFGDETCDRVPLQVGQFESGVEMDEDLDKMYLEGGGGGQVFESPELLLYFAARHTSIDCYEKRGKRGYLFFITDEKGRDVSRSAVQNVFGDGLERDISLESIIKECQDKYEIFMVLPTNAGHGSEPQISQFWKKLLGQNVLKLDDENLVCELIATTIGICEETVDDVTDLATDLKLDKAGIRSLSTALADVKTGRGTGLKAKMDGELAVAGKDNVKTL